MLFPTHLLAAAVAGRVSRLSPLWLVVGTALPDVVDKPLAAAGVVELYHSVGHSALLVVLAVPVALAGRRGRTAAVGWGLHLLLDALHVVVNGRPNDALFLAWPVALPTDPLALPPGAFARQYVGSPSFYLEAAFWLVVAGVVLRDWRAGRSPLREWGQ